MQRRDFLKTLSVVAASVLVPINLKADSFVVDVSKVEFDKNIFLKNNPQVIMIFLTGGASELAGNLTNLEEINNLSVYKYELNNSVTEHSFWDKAGGNEMERMLNSGDMNIFRTCFRKEENDLRSHGVNSLENRKAINDHKNISSHPAIFATIGKVLSDNGLVTKDSIMPFIEINGETGFFATGDYFNVPSFVKPVCFNARLKNYFKEKSYSFITKEQMDTLSNLANSINQKDDFALSLENSSKASEFVENLKQIETPQGVEYPEGEFSRGIKTAMNILINNPDTRAVAIGGAGLGRWDDHSFAFTTYIPRMRNLMKAIEAAVKHMKMANKDNISIWVFSEFGRNVNLNSANGWDHGNNQNLYIFGGKRYLNQLGIVGETEPFGDAKENRLYLKPKEGSYWFEPYSIGATIYKIFGIKNPEVLTGGYSEIKAGLLKDNSYSYDESEVANKISNYNLNSDAQNNFDVITQAIEDTPENKILLFDLEGEYEISDVIKINKPIKVVAKSPNSFTMVLINKSENVINIQSEGVVLKGLNVNGNNKTNIGIYSNSANLEISDCKVYNILYDNLDKKDVAWGIGVVLKSSTSNNSKVLLKNNEIFNIESKLYDENRGTYGLARGVHLNYHNLNSQNIEVKILQNYIYNVTSEEDDHISIADDNSASNKTYTINTLIDSNRFIGFTRRAVKAMVPNVIVSKNFCQSSSDFDTTKHPPYCAIDIMGVNSKVLSNTIILSKEFEKAIVATQENAQITNNQVTLYGGIKEQYLCFVAYNAKNFVVKNNSFTLDGAIEDSYFFYLKGNTKGKILDNEFWIKNPKDGRINALVFETVYKDETIKNDLIYQGKNYHGSVKEAIYFSGLTSQNVAMNEIYQGEYIKVVFEGNKNSSKITEKKSGWELSDVE
jgi:hypothetical protein